MAQIVLKLDKKSPRNSFANLVTPVKSVLIKKIYLKLIKIVQNSCHWKITLFSKKKNWKKPVDTLKKRRGILNRCNKAKKNPKKPHTQKSIGLPFYYFTSTGSRVARLGARCGCRQPDLALPCAPRMPPTRFRADRAKTGDLYREQTDRQTCMHACMHASWAL